MRGPKGETIDGRSGGLSGGAREVNCGTLLMAVLLWADFERGTPYRFRLGAARCSPSLPLRPLFPSPSPPACGPRWKNSAAPSVCPLCTRLYGVAGPTGKRLKVFGLKKTLEMSWSVGRAVAHFKRAKSQIQSQIQEEMRTQHGDSKRPGLVDSICD